MAIKKGTRLKHHGQKTYGTATADELPNGMVPIEQENGGKTNWVAADCDVISASGITTSDGGEQITVTSPNGNEVRFYYDKDEDCFYEGEKPAGKTFSSSKGTIGKDNLPDFYKWLKNFAGL